MVAQRVFGTALEVIEKGAGEGIPAVGAMPAHIQIDQRAQQPLQRAGDPREQSEQQGQIVIVVITENGKERQLEGHLVIGDSLRLITAHQPIPEGRMKFRRYCSLEPT